MAVLVRAAVMVVKLVAVPARSVDVTCSVVLVDTVNVTDADAREVVATENVETLIVAACVVEAVAVLVLVACAAVVVPSMVVTNSVVARLPGELKGRVSRVQGYQSLKSRQIR